jgi:cation:H+ antiporter
VGSNIFNVLVVLGATGVISGGVPVSAAAIRFDVPVMVAVAVACLPVFFTGGRVSRWEGALFLAYYAAYVACLVLTASRRDALPVLGPAALGLVLPAMVLGAGLRLWWPSDWRRRKT